MAKWLAVTVLATCDISWASSFQNLQCMNELTRTFSNAQMNFCDNGYFFSSDSSGFNAYDKATCHLINDLTLHIYQENNRMIVEVAGLHSGFFSTADASRNGMETYSRCKDVTAAVKKWATLRKIAVLPANSKSPENIDSVAVVASKRNCSGLKNVIDDWIEALTSEGKSGSALICVPDEIVGTNNPALVRQYIFENISRQKGLILVGSDLPPFEIYSKTGFSPGYAQFDYGSSDLPYGEISSVFWNQPISKLSDSLRNIVYHDENNIHLTRQPTSWAYDLDLWRASVMRGSETFEAQNNLWVSRWVADESYLKHSLRNFVERRSQFRPFLNHRYLHARGSSGVMFTPHDPDLELRTQNMLRPFFDNLPPQSRSYIMTGTQLFGLTRHIDTETTMMTYDEHGTSVGIGDLKAFRLVQMDFYPPILNLDSCQVGEWYEEESSQTFIAQLFSADRPPLVVLASQGTKWMPTIGSVDSITGDVFFDGLASGQTFGNRQLETFQNNMRHWFQNYPNDPTTSFPMQLYHSLSLFGDGSIEF